MLSSLRLRNFRSYSDASFEFEQGVNIVVGPNASGKTNLLEAILMLSYGRSYRAKDRDTVQHSKDWARIDALHNNSPRTLKLESNPQSSRVLKTFEIDGLPKKRLQLADTIPIVLFEPTDLQLLTGSPERRRSFLDALLARTEPDFSRLARMYERTLAQRNAFLKQGARNKSELFVWNLRLSEAGGKIAELRLGLVDQINKKLGKHYKDVANENKEIKAVYQTELGPASYGSHMLKKLEQEVSRDITRGFTGVGPHRDDMVLYFGEKTAIETASRGEVRTLVLGLKMLELEMVEKAREQKPLLLLDDVFSELDGARRKALTEFLKDHQTFITTTDADVVIDHFMKSAHVIAL